MADSFLLLAASFVRMKCEADPISSCVSDSGYPPNQLVFFFLSTRGTPILGHQTAIGHSLQRGALVVQISRPSEIIFTCKE